MSISESDADETILYKIILIGDSSVGKTCLFKKMTTGNFSEKMISTIGMDRKSISFNLTVKDENGVEKEKNFEIQLWDTAGQERFRSITKGYYKDSQGLFLLYDITNKETFDNLDMWINGVRQSFGTDEKEKNKYIIVLLGNKLDLANENPDNRKVTEEEAIAKCKEFDIIWGGECSAKDFTVEELEEKFKIYTKEIYNKIGNNIIKSQTAIKIASPRRKEKCPC
jgi:small GTP-binding protein